MPFIHSVGTLTLLVGCQEGHPVLKNVCFKTPYNGSLCKWVWVHRYSPRYLACRNMSSSAKLITRSSAILTCDILVLLSLVINRT